MAADADAVAVGLQDLSVSSASSTVVRPPQPNFPIPRELRDQIYGHLLHHKHVKDEPFYTRPTDKRGKYSNESSRELSLANTYRFHTNIIAVNHEISKEAAQVLDSNSFVVVSHASPFFTSIKHVLDLAIVTENQAQVAKFKRHLIRVHTANTTKGTDVKPQCFLIVAEDLPKYCAIMQWIFYTKPTPAKLVNHPDGTAPHGTSITVQARAGPSDIPSTMIQFQDKSQIDQKPELAKSMLLPFKNMIYGLQKVKIMNAPDSLTPYVQGVVRTMGPKGIWMSAMAWHMLENLQTIQDTAESFFRAGDLRRALIHYGNVMHVYDPCPLFKAEHYERSSDLDGPLSALFTLLLNAAVTSGFLHLSYHATVPKAVAHDSDAIADIAAGLCTVSGCHSHGATGCGLLENKVDASGSWLIVLYAFLNTRREDNLQRILQRMLDLHEFLGGSEHFLHDFKLISDIANDETRRAEYLSGAISDSDLISLTAAAKLPPQIFSPPSFADLKKPEGLEGFVDTVHFEKIRAADPKFAATLR